MGGSEDESERRAERKEELKDKERQRGESGETAATHQSFYPERNSPCYTGGKGV